MEQTSEAAGLKRRYTNHCVRATVVTKLKNAGYKDRAICKMTGHNNLQSLESHQKTSDKDLRGMSNALASTSYPPRTSAGLRRVALLNHSQTNTH